VVKNVYLATYVAFVFKRDIPVNPSVTFSGFSTRIASGLSYLAALEPRATFCQATPGSHSARGYNITLFQSLYLFGKILE
jgi:hypothetical protein